MQTIYVDNNATTAIAPEVVAAMQPYFTADYFNPSSMYDAARSAAHAIQAARETIARCLGGIDPDQLLFTGSATESNNAALFGCVQANPQRRHLITTAVEHPSVLEIGKELARRGLEVTFLPVDRNGELSIDAYVKALRRDTLMVSVMMANNETGVCFPVAELARIAKETDPQILVHTDATQAVGKLPVNLQTDLHEVDLLAFSGHKLHAPKGVGALFVRRGTRWRPFILGGHQERGRRAGTENVPYIVGLARACELAMAGMEEEQTRVRGMRDRLQAGAARAHPGPRSERQGCRAAPAEHPQPGDPRHRGGGDPLRAEQPGHLRLERLGLHLRHPRPLPRAQGDGGALLGDPRLAADQPEPLQYRRRDRPDHRGPAGDRRPPAPPLALLG